MVLWGNDHKRDEMIENQYHVKSITITTYLAAAFGRIVGCGELDRIVLRSKLSCNKSSVRCAGGAMCMHTASL